MPFYKSGEAGRQQCVLGDLPNVGAAKVAYRENYIWEEIKTGVFGHSVTIYFLLYF